MSEWKQELSNGSNTLADWLADRVTVTGTRTDCVLLGELMEVFRADSSPNKPSHVAPKDFVSLAKAYFTACEGVSLPKLARAMGTPKRNVVFGVALKASV